MSRQNVRVEGLKELDEAFGELPQAFRRAIMLRALRKASSPMVAEARATAPRGDDPRRRGSKKDRRSRRSITIGPGADSIKARPVKAESQFVTSVAVGPDRRHFYMRFAELGTSRQGAQRFLTRAFEGGKEAFILKFGEDLWKEIERLSKRLSRKAAAGTLSERERGALGS